MVERKNLGSRRQKHPENHYSVHENSRHPKHLDNHHSVHEGSRRQSHQNSWCALEQNADPIDAAQGLQKMLEEDAGTEQEPDAMHKDPEVHRMPQVETNQVADMA